ncbi:PTS mannitol transporter subunit IICBA [Paenibacillus provencensis]|uniref:Mannitol-specific phosphotransferase enzyme IIA component n=1 Tax=Paenibacillus provencensis TaxID=441151 RepID=A0ABW3Q204_9BACL|nr:PTS mannitol transporter subunit IICBA [Paenibacillus sp. MER 78]
MSTLEQSAPAPKKTGGVKQATQKFGRFLSAMVMPNIGAFIAWGFLTALFIEAGYLPNADLASLVDPMIKYLLPLLIAYSGGKAIHDHRGGVLGAIAAMGVIVGAEIPMFIGAMIMGPLGGYIIKQFDKYIGSKTPSGFEMLVNNFSAGIIGMLLAIAGFYGVGPVVSAFTDLLASGVDAILNWGLLPLVSIFIEPAKILFLNNAINHGILSPIGIQQAGEYGKSIMFLLEANPGPGLGLLLAYSIFGKGSIKGSAPGAAIIHFFGGIHEVYFPYVLMKPIMFVSVIVSGMAGVFTFSLLDAGLIAAASPGSIIALMLMSPKGGYIPVIAGVLVATVVSFLLSSLFLRRSAATDEDLDKAKEAVSDLKNSSKGISPNNTTGTADLNNKAQINKIIFACDAGMGSSAMGATSFRKKVKNAGLAIEVTNTAIENIPLDADLVVTQQNLTPRAKAKAPNAVHVSIDNFVNNPIYDKLIEDLKAKAEQPETSPVPEYAQEDVVESLDKTFPEDSVTAETNGEADSSGVLRKENIVLQLPSVSKEDAIRRAGESLVSAGYVQPHYVDAMIEREGVATTYIGNGVAIPHGVGDAKKEIKTSGIVIHQYPEGVEFEGGTAYLVIGIAGAGREHLQILTKIAEAIEDESTVTRLAKVTNPDELYNTFGV